MTPSATVSNITRESRLAPQADRAPMLPNSGFYPMPGDDPELPDVLVPNTVGNVAASKERLLSNTTVKAVKEENTKRNLQSNFWYDMSNYFRWASTTALIGGLVLIGQAVAGAGSMAAAFTAIGAALSTAPVILAFGLGIALAGVTIATSKHSKKLFIERSFDVQDFQMQRQAALVGQSVGQAVDTHDQKAASGERWAQSVRSPQAERLTHAARLEAQNEQSAVVER